MFCVPVNAARPTFAETVKVGVFHWLTSSRADRQEWARRRKAAAQAARVHHNATAGQAIAQSMIGRKAAAQQARRSKVSSASHPAWCGWPTCQARIPAGAAIAKHPAHGWVHAAHLTAVRA
jgi:hypothetical protein